MENYNIVLYNEKRTKFGLGQMIPPYDHVLDSQQFIR